MTPKVIRMPYAYLLYIRNQAGLKMRWMLFSFSLLDDSDSQLCLTAGQFPDSHFKYGRPMPEPRPGVTFHLGLLWNADKLKDI